MINEYAEYYSQASDVVARLGGTLTGLQFRAKDQAVEVFGLQALAICRDHCRAISILLRQNLFGEPIIISRSLFELVFALHWVLEATTREEALERVYQLEATPYYEFAKEVRLIEQDFAGPNPHWSPLKVRQFREEIETIMADSPFLVRSGNQGRPEFKKAPDLASRMGQDLRLRFYHIYRFSSFFTHPTPSLKKVYITETGTSHSAADIMDEPLKQTLAYCLLLIEILARSCCHIFDTHDPQQAATRDQYCSIISDLVDKANNNYFATSTHKRSDK